LVNLVFLGAPGTGKSTIAEEIAKKKKLKLIDMGEILREHIKKNDSIGKKLKPYLNSGILSPDKFILPIVKKETKKGNFAIDGFPRTVYEAEYLLSIAKIKHVFWLKAKTSTILKRLSLRRSCFCGEVYHLTTRPPKKKGICDKCGKKLYIREDDKPDVIRTRLSEYNKKTKLVHDFFRKKGILIEVDAEPSVPKIAKKVMTYL